MTNWQLTLGKNYIFSLLSLFAGNIVSYLVFKESAGPTVEDLSGNGRAGTAGGSSGPTFGQTGIGDGNTCITMPGSNAYINWYSASLASAFSGAEGTLMAWAKVSGAGVWSDGTSRYIARLRADDNNEVRLLRSSSNNNMILIQHIAGGTSRPFYTGWNAYTGWMQIGITWSVTDGAVIGYVNGANKTTNLGAPGTWSGALSETTTLIGSASTTPGSVWSGSLAHLLLLDRAATNAEMLTAFRLIRTPVVISVIGDSISTEGTNLLKWTGIVRDGYNSGVCSLIPHAASGAGILHNDGYQDMDDFVTAAAGDNADIIIIEMGTNDTTTTGLQAEVEENIIELKASNPNATIYYMNILPRWTDETGDTELDKSAFRTAIAAACTAQSVTCWDTYSTPWITADDTADGLHPNASGYSKIAAEVLARLP